MGNPLLIPRFVVSSPVPPRCLSSTATSTSSSKSTWRSSWRRYCTPSSSGWWPCTRGRSTAAGIYSRMMRCAGMFGWLAVGARASHVFCSCFVPLDGFGNYVFAVVVVVMLTLLLLGPLPSLFLECAVAIVFVVVSRPHLSSPLRSGYGRYKDLKQQHRRTAQKLGIRHADLKYGIGTWRAVRVRGLACMQTHTSRAHPYATRAVNALGFRRATGLGLSDRVGTDAGREPWVNARPGCHAFAVCPSCSRLCHRKAGLRAEYSFA